MRNTDQFPNTAYHSYNVFETLRNLFTGSNSDLAHHAKFTERTGSSIRARASIAQLHRKTLSWHIHNSTTLMQNGSQMVQI